MLVVGILLVNIGLIAAKATQPHRVVVSSRYGVSVSCDTDEPLKVGDEVQIAVNGHCRKADGNSVGRIVWVGDGVAAFTARGTVWVEGK